MAEAGTVRGSLELATDGGLLAVLTRIANALDRAYPKPTYAPKPPRFAEGGTYTTIKGDYIVQNHRQDEDPYDDEDETFLRGIE